MLGLLICEMARTEIMVQLGLRDEKHFREHYQQVAMAAGLIERTLPDKPNSRLQKYRLTEKGRSLLP
jgi:ATP-dependent DNA helicase RecG